MKRNAIAKIVIYSLLILILSGILLAGLGICLFVVDVDREVTQHQVSEGSLSPDSIREMEIEWAAGDIHIIAADTDRITVSESGDFSEKYQMVLEQDGTTLAIQYSRKSVTVGFGFVPSKDLTITVPRDWVFRELSIDAASVNIQACGLQVEKMDLDLASAEGQFDQCRFGNVDIDTASGKLNFNGSLETMDCDAASADISAALTNVPSRLAFDSASGTVELTLPAEAGFVAEVDTLSGRFHSDFDTTYQSDRYVCNDGACNISMSGLSGNLTIRKA